MMNDRGDPGRSEESAGVALEAPTPPDGYENWLDFAVASLEAPGVEAPLGPDARVAGRGTLSAREAGRRELAILRDQAKSSRLVVRTLIAQTVVSLVRDTAQSAAVREFDAEAWSEAWMDRPVAELYGLSPLEAILTSRGWRQVEGLLERMAGGFAA